jgi:hypothetical protein
MRSKNKLKKHSSQPHKLCKRQHAELVEDGDITGGTATNDHASKACGAAGRALEGARDKIAAAADGARHAIDDAAHAAKDQAAKACGAAESALEGARDKTSAVAGGGAAQDAEAKGRGLFGGVFKRGNSKADSSDKGAAVAGAAAAGGAALGGVAAGIAKAGERASDATSSAACAANIEAAKAGRAVESALEGARDKSDVAVGYNPVDSGPTGSPGGLASAGGEPKVGAVYASLAPRNDGASGAFASTHAIEEALRRAMAALAEAGSAGTRSAAAELAASAAALESAVAGIAAPRST